ncbi:MAG TPA: hypothetical protein VL981_01775 [Candidatus Methylacidiphilales bacterium]|nr:hypothetical protein [Candidatus Methylacidiphilales bacterium]
MKSRLIALPALAGLFILNSGGSAFGCAFCADTSGGPMTQAANWGIFAMVIIVFAMLGALVGFGFYLNYRAKHPLPDYEELLNEGETRPEPGSSP